MEGWLLHHDTSVISLDLRAKRNFLTTQRRSNMDPTSPTPRSQTYHFRVAVERRQVEGRASVLVCVVGGGSALHQETDDGQMSFEAGPAQSG